MNDAVLHLSSIVSAVSAFFFEAPVPRGLYAFRILFGTTLFLESLHLLGFGWQLYSEDGLFPAATCTPMFRRRRRWNPFIRFGSRRHTPFIVGIYSIACACLALGIGTRVAALGVFLFSASRRSRNFWVASSSDSVATLCSLVLLFGNSGGNYSLDALYHTPHILSGIADPSAWTAQLLRILLSTIYFRTAEAKLKNPRWYDGTVVYHLLAYSGGSRRLPMPPFMTYRWASSLATWGTIGVQLFASVFLWVDATRWIAMTMVISLHIGLELFMNIKHFQYLMIAMVLLFVP